MRIPIWVAIVAATCIVVLPAQATEQSRNVAGLKVSIWATPGGGPKPVIIFSHGFHGCATQSRFLMEAFAAHGFLVFAPNHHDATCNGGSSRWFDRPATPFSKPAAWSESDFRDRGEDIRRLIAALRADSQFDALADWSRLGLAGHSLGGYTVLALAGAWPTWKITGIKAVLALSPYSQPFIIRHGLARIDAPIMYQGGTWDFGITPAIDKHGGAYEQSVPPKYFVELSNVGHFAWTDLQKSAHTPIVAYSVAFMDHYLKGEPAAPDLTRRADGIAVLRCDSDVGYVDRGGAHKPDRLGQ
jgi:pimeloyl-ACP methyl ester carboxylesterase